VTVNSYLCLDAPLLSIFDGIREQVDEYLTHPILISDNDQAAITAWVRQIQFNSSLFSFKSQDIQAFSDETDKITGLEVQNQRLGL